MVTMVLNSGREDLGNSYRRGADDSIRNETNHGIAGRALMKNSITDVPGIRVGNAQDCNGGTGCTVLLCEEGAVAGVDVRGGAPGTRELACLNPMNLVEEVHAVYLGGGSAYGLDGASGVMQYLEERGKGLNVGVGVVPIVPGAVLFDLPVGRADIRPDKEMGYRAAGEASDAAVAQGNVGAGEGATVGKPLGLDCMMKGGLGSASFSIGDLIVGALVVVNCFGDVVDPSTGKIVAGTLNSEKMGFADAQRVVNEAPGEEEHVFKSNTTIGIIATNARLTKAQATKVAMMAHDGYARAIRPVHTMYDGDTIFCLGLKGLRADITNLGSIAAEVMGKAILSGVKAAESAYGVPGYGEISRRLPSS